MLSGIILSAGGSTRMGTPKALLTVNGGLTFLESLAGAFARAGIGPIVVVTGPHHDEVRRVVDARRLTVRIVRNPDPDRGQLSSLLCGLDALEALAGATGDDFDGVMVTPIDAPLVSARTLTRLASEWASVGASIARPAMPDGRHGHPVIFGRSVFEALRAADPAVGAKAVVRALGDRVLNVPVEDAGAFMDIDTPEDYARVVRDEG
ncbi:MAG: nucleotidyltransferase family protein [Vicinamibacterales bacterium]